ncbi:unnamed protein product [Orchesella dallaii]|uniref:Uncharacterized protein n=1 Tax=Orchesella dallaii TaxID=48710 RepID=A0ABP1PWJ1_9HEXA
MASWSLGGGYDDRPTYNYSAPSWIRRDSNIMGWDWDNLILDAADTEQKPKSYKKKVISRLDHIYIVTASVTNIKRAEFFIHNQYLGGGGGGGSRDLTLS